MLAYQLFMKHIQNGAKKQNKSMQNTNSFYILGKDTGASPKSISRVNRVSVLSKYAHRFFFKTTADKNESQWLSNTWLQNTAV